MRAAASRWLALAPLLGSGCGVCASIGEPVDLGIVDDDRVEEASGLAWGGAAWWAHNDTDETPALYAIDGQARVVAQVRMLAVSPVDVEDIAARYEGGAPVELLIGDIGDNDGDRDEIVLLRAPTPAVESGDLRVERVVWTYDDGEARDAEALLVDPTDGAPYVITQEADGGAAVFRAAGASAVADVLERVGDVTPFGDGDARVTAGDVSPDGRRVALRTRGYVAAWERRDGETLTDVFTRRPCVRPLADEPQGEALAFDDAGFATLSEGPGQALRWYPWGP